MTGLEELMQSTTFDTFALLFMYGLLWVAIGLAFLLGIRKKKGDSHDH